MQFYIIYDVTRKPGTNNLHMKNLWKKLVQYLFSKTQVDEKAEELLESAKTKIGEVEEKIKKVTKPKAGKK